MLLQPDRYLVAERAALPHYAPADTPPAEPSQATWGSFTSSESRVIVQAEEEKERVAVLLPPPPVTYKFVSFIRDTPHDRQVISTSREGLAEYRTTYEGPPGWPHPLRIRKAHHSGHSGLPAFLTGFLEADEVSPISDDPQRVATGWLQRETHAKALFGTKLAKIEDRLRYVDDGRVDQRRDREVQSDTPLPDKQAVTMVHARFQQWHRQTWPVFGGQVVVHMTGADPRMSVTSSYFPLSPDVDFSPRISIAQAKDIALQALVGYLAGPGAIGLLWDMLAPWLATVDRDEPATTESLLPLDAYVSNRLSLALLAYGRKRDPTLAALIESALGGPRADLLALLRDLWKGRAEYAVPEWQANVVLYHGEEQFIFPFAGRYHLTYRIEFLSSARDDGWRVFVDAEDGMVLGRPECLVVHDRSYYADAANLLDQPDNPAQLPAAAAPLAPKIQPFMTLTFHSDQGGGDVPLNQIEGQPAEATTQVEHEAVNVAYHAWTIYRHFIDVCDVQEAMLNSYAYTDEGGSEITQSPPLEVIVGKGGDGLDMGFLYADTQHPKVVTFQTDALGGPGLAAEGLHRVYTPSLDPEVIYHEMAHGLMWLLNRAPSDQPNASVPFGRALLEGYANYFARSLATRQDAALHLWARAAYRHADWGDEWSLSRNRQEPGEDVLPAPNLYPETETAGLPVYDVGMVWARALWDIRNLLTQRLGQPAGPDLTDRLALNAFDYVHGWIANFEIAAEGLIASARILLTDNPQVEAIIEAIIDIFARRRILAERGVQALCQANDGQGGTAWVVGTDAGLKYTRDGGQNWSDWVQPQGEVGSASRGVVALTSEGSTVYAVTEMGVYEWDSSQPNSAWSPLGQFPVTETPLSMLVVNGNLYVGSGHGIWRYDRPNHNWTSWNPGAQPFAGIALSLANMSLPAGGQQHLICLVAAITDTLFSEQTAVPAWGNLGSIQTGPSGQTAWFIAVAVVENTVYAGTLSQGVFSQVMDYTPDWGPTRTHWNPVPAGALADAAVLCLAADGDHKLFAGTTSGLFEIDPTSGAGWSGIAGLPADAIVTSVLPAGDRLLVGTAAQGLWISRPVSGGTAWDQFAGIGA